MEDIQQIVSVPVITALVYGAMMLYKYTVDGKESLIRLIPVIAVLLGCGLGIAVYYVTPELLPASNIFTAILVGGASGLAATGTHQMFKQLQKTDDNFDLTDNSLGLEEKSHDEAFETVKKDENEIKDEEKAKTETEDNESENDENTKA